MAHTVAKLSGVYGTDILPAGSYDTTVAGHTGPYQNLLKPICAVAYVSANVSISAATGENGDPIENLFVYGSGTALVSADGQMIFTEDVYAFTTDQPVKVWYAK